jgi:UDP-3-O-[3-hydroxymyristoyl] glucosamine N-acyltransferase
LQGHTAGVIATNRNLFIMGIEERLSRLAEMVGGELLGDPEVRIRGVNELAAAGDGDITFIAKPAMAEVANASGASAVIMPSDAIQSTKPGIRVKNPYLAIAIIHNYFMQTPFSATGIHPGAHVGDECRIPQAVAIGPRAVLGQGVILGERVTIGPGTVIGDRTVIGDDCQLHANVTIYPQCRIGNRVIIQSGAVIGSDGFGYATDEQGRHVKRPHVGVVEIEDDVEIGANACIDRATFGKTVISRGSKIDNMVQLAHNVKVGENCLIVAQVGIAGSTSLGRGVVVGGQVGVVGHVHLGDGVMIAGKSGVHNNQKPGSIIAGIPAIPHKKWAQAVSAFQKLPELIKDVRTLQKLVAEMGYKTPPTGGQDED